MAGNSNDKHANEAARKASEAATEAAQGAREKLDEAIQHGAEAVDEARQRGAEALHTARQGAADMAANVRDEAGRLYRSGEKRVAGMADEAMHEAEAYYDELSQIVRRQPATALGVAAGIGFLVGLLIARR